MELMLAKPVPFLVAILLAVLVSPAVGEDWPQLARTPQRTGYTPETVKPPFKTAWVIDFRRRDPPERISDPAQIVSAGGLAYIGTLSGNFLGINVKDGSFAWTFHADAGIGHTAGLADGKVFFATVGGGVYGLDARSGRQVWRFSTGDRRYGFSTGVLLAEGKVLLGDREGIFYALNQADGTLAWKTPLGGAILYTAAYDAGKVFVSAMDLRTYALDAKDGRILWRTEPVAGVGFFNYFPVVWKGKVIVNPRKPYDIYSHSLEHPKPEVQFPFWEFKYEMKPEEIKAWIDAHRKDLDGTGLKSAEFAAAQEKIIQAFEKNPHRMVSYVFDEETGKPVRPWPVNFCTLSGETYPPCVDNDGLLVMPVAFYQNGWCRVDATTGRIVDVLFDLAAFDQGEVPGVGNPDENMAAVGAGRIVFLHHRLPIRSGAQYIGYFNLDTRRWTQWGPSAAIGARITNTQEAAASVSIANGMLFFNAKDRISADWVDGREGSPPPAGPAD